MRITLSPGIENEFFKLLNTLYAPFLSAAHLKDKFQYTVYLDNYPFPVGIVSASKFVQIALIPSLHACGVGEMVIREFVRVTNQKRYGWTCKKENYPSLKLLAKLGGGISVNSATSKSKKTFEGFFYPDKAVSRVMQEQIKNALPESHSKYAEWYKNIYLTREHEFEVLHKYLCSFIGVIDSHQHLLTSEVIGTELKLVGGLDPRFIRASSSPKNIKRSVVFAIQDNNIDLEKANDEVFQYANEHAEIVPGAILYDGIRIEEYFNKQCRVFKEHVYGLRILKDAEGKFCLAPPERIKLYKSIAKNRCLLISHMGPNVVERVLDIVKKVPNLKIILAHLGSPMDHRKTWNQVIDDLKKLKAYENVFFDISSVNDEAVIGEALDIITENRLIWGSDTPYDTPQQALEFFFGLKDMSIIQKYKIAYANLHNLLTEALYNEKL